MELIRTNNLNLESIQNTSMNFNSFGSCRYEIVNFLFRLKKHYNAKHLLVSAADNVAQRQLANDLLDTLETLKETEADCASVTMSLWPNVSKGTPNGDLIVPFDCFYDASNLEATKGLPEGCLPVIVKYTKPGQLLFTISLELTKADERFQNIINRDMSSLKGFLTTVNTKEKTYSETLYTGELDISIKSIHKATDHAAMDSLPI